MKTIIAGSRTITDFKVVYEAIKGSGFKITEVVCGECRGPDMLGAEWAKLNKIPVKYFPADWKKLGIKAGPRRNTDMAKYSDALILVWDGKSPGSKNMLKEAKHFELQIYVHNNQKIHTNPSEVIVPAVDIQQVFR